MGRTTRLALTIGSPESAEACLLCAKMDWLGERVKQFHKHIAKEEKRLYARWRSNNAPRIKEQKVCQLALERWTRISSGVIWELGRRQRRLTTQKLQWRRNKSKVQSWFEQRNQRLAAIVTSDPEQLVSDKITRLGKRIKRYGVLIEKVPVKINQLKADLKEYTSIIKKESTKYVAQQFPWPVHLAWEKKLNGVLSNWQNGHPLCAWCGLRFGGFHVAQENYLASGEKVCQFCKKESRQLRSDAPASVGIATPLPLPLTVELKDGGMMDILDEESIEDGE